MARRQGDYPEAAPIGRPESRPAALCPQLRQLPRSRGEGDGPARPDYIRVRRIWPSTSTRWTGWASSLWNGSRGNRHAGVARSSVRRICPPWRKWCADFTPRSRNRPFRRTCSISALASMRLTARSVTERTGRETARPRASSPSRPRISGRSARAWQRASAHCATESKERRWLPGRVELSEAELSAVAYYVRGFFQGGT